MRERMGSGTRRIPVRRGATVAGLVVSVLGMFGPGNALASGAVRASGDRPVPRRRPAATGGLRADFNGDGFADLAVGSPGEDIGSVADAGGVNVLYGSAGGLSATAVPNQFWSQDSPDVEDMAEPKDAFGSALAAADFNGDGFADLAIGVPNEVVGDHATGALNVLYGSPSGLSATFVPDQFWSKDSPGMPGAPDGQFGESLSAGDFDGDSFPDLAVGTPAQTVDSVQVAGAVEILPGGPVGLSTMGAQQWSQDSPSVQGVAELNDQFGHAVSTGDFNGDGFADLVVGVPNQLVGTAFDAGAVNVLYGSAAGLASLGNQLLTQDTPGILDTSEIFDEFGSAVTTGDFDGDGFGDLAVGVFDEDQSPDVQATGAVNVVYGTSAGLATPRNQFWTQDSPGIFGTSEAGDAMGWSLVAADFNHDARSDLAVGAAYEGFPMAAGGGTMNVIYGSATGLASDGNQVWNQNTSGILNQVERDDHFSWSLTAGDFDGDGRADLAVGVPHEDAEIQGFTDAGAVNVLYDGLGSAGNQLWNQDSTAVADQSESGDTFGFAVASG
jgi:FG-GAP repeat